MQKSLRAALLGSALAMAVPMAALVATPAQALSVSISFNTFHDRLAAHGSWVYSDRWGEVWMPRAVSADFRPYYTGGHWVDTEEYGWVWVSDYDWGDVTFHYGRWVDDPDDGWMWIPGYVWSPGWVVWRRNAQYVGWMPAPPDEAFLSASDVSGTSVSFGIDFNRVDDYYGYSRWYGPSYSEARFAAGWTFVEPGHLVDRDYRRVALPPARVVNVIHNTTNVTNYTVVNNYVVNKSIDTHAIPGAAPRPVKAAAVLRNAALVTPTTVGRDAQLRMRETIPRGNGTPNSAPKPSDAVVRTLSPTAATTTGRAPSHVYTRDTITKASLPTAPATKPGAENAAGTPPNDRAMTGPEGTRHKGEAPAGNREVPGTAAPRATEGSTATGTAPVETRPRRERPGTMTGPASGPGSSGTTPTEGTPAERRARERPTEPTGTAPMGGTGPSPAEGRHHGAPLTSPGQTEPTGTTAGEPRGRDRGMDRSGEMGGTPPARERALPPDRGAMRPNGEAPAAAMPPRERPVEVPPATRAAPDRPAKSDAPDRKTGEDRPE